VDEKQHRLTFEYDASRLRETQIAHLLGQAGIPIVGKLASDGGADPLPLEKTSLPR
jgi:hypothetical protein